MATTVAFLSAHHTSEVEIIVTDANDEPQDWTAAEFLDHFQWVHEKLEDRYFAYRPDNDDRYQEEAGALTEESSHGGTKSVYGVDPDGNEFEVVWLSPASRGASRSSRRSWSASISPPRWSADPAARRRPERRTCLDIPMRYT